jgi:hypothetical protein
MIGPNNPIDYLVSYAMMDHIGENDMINYTVKCRMITPRGQTLTKETIVRANDSNEARAKAKVVYQRRGNKSVESLAAY